MFKTKKWRIKELESYLRNSRSENENLRNELKKLQESVDGQLDKVIVRCKNCKYAAVLNLYDNIRDIGIDDIYRSIIVCDVEYPIYTLVEPEHYCGKGYSGKSDVYSVCRKWK